MRCHVHLLLEGELKGLTLLSDLIQQVTQETNFIHKVLVDVHLLLLSGLCLEVQVLGNLQDSKI